MSGKNEPTAKTSRPDTMNTFKARIERDIRQLNSKLCELAGKPETAGKSTFNSEDPFKGTFKLLEEIRKKREKALE